MASLRISTARGFTLIETLIVLGLVAIIGGFTIVVNLNDLRIGAFRDERATLVIALQKARSASLNNINLKPHGVAIFPSDRPDSYVIFEGESYGGVDYDPTKDEVLKSEYPVTLDSGSPEEILFSQLSAEALCDGVACTDTLPITLLDDARGASFDIFVNEEGRISW